jgi:hypothetical protein
MFDEMDPDKDNLVSLEEFTNWWYFGSLSDKFKENSKRNEI